MYEEFNCLNDVFNRVKPALYSKVEELKRNNISYVKEEDIWNFLSTKLWRNKSNLNISEIVSDIFDTSNEEIKSYVLSLLEKEKRYANKESLL
ncbi:MAG: post-transcriptional regulator [Bacilli bacterium]